MTLLIQDAVVTMLALGAVALLARRVVGVFSPPAAAPGCTSCASCPAPRVTRDDTKPVPLAILKGSRR
jgi:hypothetical protein